MNETRRQTIVSALVEDRDLPLNLQPLVSITSEIGKLAVQLEVNRPGLIEMVKAHALFFVDVLCRSGWSVTEGCGIVGQSLQGNGIRLGGRIDSPSWKSVKGWRDRFTKLAEDDQTRTTFEGLKPHIDPLGPFTKEEARDWVKGQMREVLSKMGSSAAE